MCTNTPFLPRLIYQKRALLEASDCSFTLNWLRGAVQIRRALRCFKDNSENCPRAEASVYIQRDQQKAPKAIWWVINLNPPGSHGYDTTSIIILRMLSAFSFTCYLLRLDGKTLQPASLPLSETYLKIPARRYLVRAGCRKHLLERLPLVINHNAGKRAQKNDRNLPSSLSCNHERIN